jgi:hypothetical protein
MQKQLVSATDMDEILGGSCWTQPVGQYCYGITYEVLGEIYTDTICETIYVTICS